MGAVLTVYKAKRIYTLDASLPVATHIAVANGRVVAVGDASCYEPWRGQFSSLKFDDRLAQHTLLPGLIDNHIHPFLGAILLPSQIIAPEAWRMADATVVPAALDATGYKNRLLAAAHNTQGEEWLISFGYQSTLHGDMSRPALDALFPQRAVMLIQRSFHESYINTAGLAKLGLDEATVRSRAQTDWERGHFFETGQALAIERILPYLMRPQWYDKGLAQVAALMHTGGITTCADMLFGAISPEFEDAALQRVVQAQQAPTRVVNVFDARSFANRASGKSGIGQSHEPIDFPKAIAAMQPWIDRGDSSVGSRVWYSKAIKLFADGAMFSQLMQMNPPGYTDGHEGEWLMTPQVLSSGIDTFWGAGQGHSASDAWQIHIHVNGDMGVDAVLQAIAQAQERRPRFDHRTLLHHVGFHTNAQSKRMAALGVHASLNPYYVHALADDYALLGLGPERAAQLSRSQSLVSEGARVSLHSDFLMAPCEPLFLAWCAATRQTAKGHVVAPNERLSLMQALKAITIDAAWGLGLDHEVGSLSAGKRADMCVLAQDPMALGSQHLKDIAVVGTVFEGQYHPLPNPQRSIHSLIGQTSSSIFSNLLFGLKRARPKQAYQLVHRANQDSCRIAGLYG